MMDINLAKVVAELKSQYRDCGDRRTMRAWRSVWRVVRHVWEGHDRVLGVLTSN